MLGPRHIISQDNLECSCFEFAAPQQNWFLSRSTVTDSKPTITSTNQLPPNVQHALTSSNLKRSLKRQPKPAKMNPEANLTESAGNSVFSVQSSLQPHKLKLQQWRQIKSSANIPLASEIHNIPQFSTNNDDRHPDSKSFDNYHKIFESQTRISNFGVHSPKINFNIAKDYPPQRLIETGKQRQPTYQFYGATMHKSASTTLIQQAHTQAHRQTRTQQTQRAVHELFEPKPPQQPHQAKEASFSKGEKHTKDRRQRKLSKVFYSCDLTNEVPKKMNVQDVAKMSLIKSKGPEAKNRSGEKKQRGRLFLRKMSEVEEIKSLMDEEDIEDSDQESVVLGRLEEYNKTELHFNEIPQLEKEAMDNHSITSTVMTVPNSRLNQRALLYQSIF